MLSVSEADVLVVSKLDRLSRSLLDFAGLMERSRDEGWSLVALDLGVDTTSAAGEMMAGVLAVFSQFERQLISERTKAGLAIKRAQGVRIGRPVEIPSDVHQRIVEAREAGMSYSAIAEKLNGDGIRTARGRGVWYPSTIYAAVKASREPVGSLPIPIVER